MANVSTFENPDKTVLDSSGIEADLLHASGHDAFSQYEDFLCMNANRTTAPTQEDLMVIRNAGTQLVVRTVEHAVA